MHANGVKVSAATSSFASGFRKIAANMCVRESRCRALAATSPTVPSSLKTLPVNGTIGVDPGPFTASAVARYCYLVVMVNS